MKRTIVVLFALVAVLFCLAACGGGERLYVFNWGDYLDEDIFDEFEKETGIRVIYETYDSNETMYAKIKPGNASYDVAFPSDYMIEKMIKEDMLEKIDLGNIPNLEHIGNSFMNMPYDRENEYSVPYMWGTVGILYNTDMVSEPVDSWNILWDEKYKGQIFMYDSQRDAFAPALKKLGFSVNTTDSDELQQAKNELIFQKPLVQAYLGDSVKDKMVGNEGALAVVYSGDAIYAIFENPSLDYALPVEGSNLWFDAMVIPKGAKNKANAEKFINFMCEPKIALANTEYVGYSTVNLTAYDMLADDIKYDDVYWPDVNLLENCEVFIDLGSFTAEYDKAWTEVMAATP